MRDIKKDEFLQKILHDTTHCSSVSCTILGWKDWDYFVDFCDENMGISEIQRSIYHEIPLIINCTNLELNLLLSKYMEYPFLHSINTKIVFYYDIHIWYENKYIIYNPALEKIIEKKINIFQKMTGWVKKTEWYHSIKLEYPNSIE